MKKNAWHYLQLSIAYLLLITGVVFLVSPIPIGLFLIGVGLSILIYASEGVQHKVHYYRKRHNGLNEKLIWVEDNLEHRIEFISDTLRKTRP